jgi:restriction endonuclease Mrr
MAKKSDFPNSNEVMQAIIHLLKEHKSLKSNDIDEKIAELFKLTDEQTKRLHKIGSGNRTEFKYRMAWIRTKMKNLDLIMQDEKRLWILIKQ